MCVRTRTEVLHGRDMYAADGRFCQTADIHHIWYKTNKHGPHPCVPNDVSRGRPSKREEATASAVGFGTHGRDRRPTMAAATSADAQQQLQHQQQLVDTIAGLCAVLDTDPEAMFDLCELVGQSYGMDGTIAGAASGVMCVKREADD